MKSQQHCELDSLEVDCDFMNYGIETVASIIKGSNRVKSNGNQFTARSGSRESFAESFCPQQSPAARHEQHCPCSATPARAHQEADRDSRRRCSQSREAATHARPRHDAGHQTTMTEITQAKVRTQYCKSFKSLYLLSKVVTPLQSKFFIVI